MYDFIQAMYQVPFIIWAVHIADGVFTEPRQLPLLAAGFLVAGALAWFGARRLRDEEIPRVALLTAAFFLASSVHIRVGPTSVHLLLNGLVGVVLGRRAALAIPVGLFLQAVLLQHGGYTTLGVNCCVLVIPALLAGWGFALVQYIPWLRPPGFRAALVAGCALAWLLGLTYSIALLAGNSFDLAGDWDLAAANRLTFHPGTIMAALLGAGLAAWLERRLEHAPEFPLGLLVGGLTVMLTLLLNCLVLSVREEWRYLALAVLVAHMPVAVVEGVVVGFIVSFLVRVRPELIGVRLPALPCPASSPLGSDQVQAL